MKRNKIAILLLSASMLVSCNDFLDTLPDKRAELDNPQKIAQILVSAYPTELPTLMFEMMSDNISDNGPLYTSLYSAQTLEQSYKYQNVTDPDWDVPQRVWGQTYKSIASANQALKAIDDLGNPEETNGSKAEALLCRAYGHFILANTFCIAYNPQTSTTDMGIPYVTAPETTVNPKYERGTVAQVYESISKDIEAALPLLEDNFSQPVYHFNSKAAYAFAAQFNLFYGKWDKVVEYATKSIGENPSAQFRDVSYVNSFSQPLDRFYAYINKDVPANLMILPQRSLWGRIYNIRSAYARYGQPRAKANYTFWQYFPWNSIANGYSSVFGSDQNIYFPKCNEIFETIDATAGIGQPHTVLIPFTVEETLMCRAEAYIMLDRYQDAVRDLNYWYAYNSPAHTTYTQEQISQWYGIDRARTPYYKMDSRFYNTGDELKDNLVRAVLAIRRLDGVHVGYRWLDIRRHGITVEHPVYRTTTEYDVITLKPYDNRTAIQLPQDVTIADIPANPRDKDSDDNNVIYSEDLSKVQINN